MYSLIRTQGLEKTAKLITVGPTSIRNSRVFHHFWKNLYWRKVEKNLSQNLKFKKKTLTHCVRLVITFNGIIIKMSFYYTKSQYFYSINYYCTYFIYNYLNVTMGLFLHLIIIDIYNIFVEKHTNWIINHGIINEYHYIVHNYNISCLLNQDTSSHFFLLRPHDIYLIVNMVLFLH